MCSQGTTALGVMSEAISGLLWRRVPELVRARGCKWVIKCSETLYDGMTA